MTNEVEPTGVCWCGCGEAIGAGSFFKAGHDKRVVSAIMALHYSDSVPRWMTTHGYSPDRSPVDAAVSAGLWQRCPSCGFPGPERGVTEHRRRGCGVSSVRASRRARRTG